MNLDMNKACRWIIKLTRTSCYGGLWGLEDPPWGPHAVPVMTLTGL